jgi:hypothetical protein
LGHFPRAPEQFVASPLCLVGHRFHLTIRGIDVHASATADDDSPGWQELAPQLAAQPVHVDLVGGPADRRTREPLGEIVAIPAGIYHQVRVRFVTELSVAGDRITVKNGCRGGGFNCTVRADGTLQPLFFDGGSPELRITSERIVGGFLLILPDIDRDMVIEMEPVWSWFAVDKHFRLLPVLTGNVKIERSEFGELGTPVGSLTVPFQGKRTAQLLRCPRKDPSAASLQLESS